MPLFLFIFHIFFYIHTYIHSITFIQYIYPSPFAGASLHLLIAWKLSGKTLPVVPSRESNSGLPYSKPTRYKPWKKKLGLILRVLTSIGTIAGGNLTSFPLAICIKKSACVQCFADFLIIVVGRSTCVEPIWATLFVGRIYCGTSKALNLCIVRGENPPVVPVFTVILIFAEFAVENPRELKEKQHKNWPLSDEVTAGIEKNPDKEPPAIMNFAALVTWFNQVA